MSVLKQRLHRKNSAGVYDVVRLETSSDLVIRPDGSTVEDAIISVKQSITNINTDGAKPSNHASTHKTSGTDPITPASIGAAASSHGTHVSFTTTVPKVAGTAAVGTATTVSRSDHVHPAQTTVSGNAGTATKLATARTIRTNLASTGTASFDGSANVTPGVTGILPIANGGTGVNTIAKLKEALGVSSSTGTSGGNGAISGTTTSGGTVTFDNLKWIVVDDGVRNSNEKVLMMQDILILEGYWDMPGWCNAFWNYILSPEARAKCTPHHVTELGKYAYRLPVFIPTRTEANGGFAYLSNNANRIGKQNGTAKEWWVSTPVNGGVYYVGSDGSVNDYKLPGYAYGFRPFVALKK